MAGRQYYSRRAERDPALVRLDLPRLKELILATYQDFSDRGYFAEALGQSCEDGYASGYAGGDIARFFFLRTRKKNLWPILDNLESYSEEDLFDIVELLYDLVSKPQGTFSHGWNNSCVHYRDFAREAGQEEFRSQINPHLNDYGSGFELSAGGEILARERGYEILLDAKMPALDPENIEARVEEAVRKFRRHNASRADKREAVRLLADVLEYLRPKLKQVLTKGDEADLFNIANNFGIRHHNPKQKTHYDQDIWLRWMFYYYLSTIHATTRLLVKSRF